MQPQTQYKKNKISTKVQQLQLRKDYQRIDGKPFGYWLKKNAYYHQQIKNFYRFMIPEGSRILHVNCRNGYLLHALKPVWAVGVDEDGAVIQEAQKNYGAYTFYKGTVANIPESFTVDYIILSCTTMEIYDIQELLEQLYRFCCRATRIIIDTYSYLWEPVLKITQRLGLKRPTNFQHWISHYDVHNFLNLAGYDVITSGYHMLFPAYIPLVSSFFNSVVANIPLLDRLCLHQWVIARPLPDRLDEHQYTVSIIIPCKNEYGNIECLIKKTPLLGKHTEFIFVDGNSNDGTFDEIMRVATTYRQKDIRYFIQDGKGKGDAVRMGFAHARGDILIILDADLTMPPEELPKFLQALLLGKGELINGSRLVYGMESGSMRFLNLLANYTIGKLISWLLGQRIKDTLCGTKVFFKTDYEKIAKNRTFFGNFDPYGDFDLLFGGAKLHLKIIDVPIHYKRRVYGSSKISRFKGGFLLWTMGLFGIKKFKLKK